MLQAAHELGYVKRGVSDRIGKQAGDQFFDSLGVPGFFRFLLLFEQGAPFMAAHMPVRPFHAALRVGQEILHDRRQLLEGDFLSRRAQLVQIYVTQGVANRFDVEILNMIASVLFIYRRLGPSQYILRIFVIQENRVVQGGLMESPRFRGSFYDDKSQLTAARHARLPAKEVDVVFFMLKERC